MPKATKDFSLHWESQAFGQAREEMNSGQESS